MGLLFRVITWLNHNQIKEFQENCCKFFFASFTTPHLFYTIKYTYSNDLVCWHCTNSKNCYIFLLDLLPTWMEPNGWVHKSLHRASTTKLCTVVLQKYLWKIQEFFFFIWKPVENLITRNQRKIISYCIQHIKG